MRNLGGLLVLILGLAVVAFTVRTALMPHGSNAAQTEPKRQLDNVRERAKELEKEQQQQADDIAKRAAEQ